MSTNAVEKNAQALNQILCTEGKKLGKTWRQRIRLLLGQTFEALNAKPLDGTRCRQLSDQIDRELAAIQNGEPIEQEADTTTPESAAAKPKTTAPQNSCSSVDSSEALSSQSSDIPQLNAAEPSASEPADKKPESSEEIGLFDLIHIKIRCFFKIRACVRPPYIGKFVCFADRFAEVRQERIDKFIGVLSNGEEDFIAKTEVDVGYQEDLLPDMPERGLVLHPRKKKRS